MVEASPKKPVRCLAYALQEEYGAKDFAKWETEQRQQAKQELQDMDLAAQAQAQVEQEEAELKIKVRSPLVTLSLPILPCEALCDCSLQ